MSVGGREREEREIEREREEGVGEGGAAVAETNVARQPRSATHIM